MSENNVQRRHIDGIEYIVTKRPAYEQMGLQFSIMNIIGSGIGGIGNLDLPEKDSKPQAWISLMGAVMGSTNPREAMVLFMQIIALARARVEDDLKPIDQITFNKLFGGNLLSAYKVVSFVLEVQFSDFLEPLLGAYGKATQQESTTTQDTQTSSGKLPQRL